MKHSMKSLVVGLGLWTIVLAGVSEATILDTYDNPSNDYFIVFTGSMNTQTPNYDEVKLTTGVGGGAGYWRSLTNSGGIISFTDGGSDWKVARIWKNYQFTPGVSNWASVDVLSLTPSPSLNGISLFSTNAPSWTGLGGGNTISLLDIGGDMRLQLYTNGVDAGFTQVTGPGSSVDRTTKLTVLSDNRVVASYLTNGVEKILMTNSTFVGSAPFEWFGPTAVRWGGSQSISYFDNLAASTIPEPDSLVLAMMGIMALGFIRHRTMVNRP